MVRGLARPVAKSSTLNPGGASGQTLSGRGTIWARVVDAGEPRFEICWEEAGWRVPQDIGLIQLEWRKDHGDWAGMHQHNDEVGEAAVEMIIGMIHRNQIGVPEFPRATLIGSSWVDGKTVSRRSGRAKSKLTADA